MSAVNINFTPFPILTTQRLKLRKLSPGDSEKIFILRSDPENNKYIGRPRASNPVDALSFINNINAMIQKNEAVYWGICLKEDLQLIGTICLWNISKENAAAETGYELLPEAQGKGYIREALEEVLNFGFKDMGLKKIEAYVHPENLRSIKILNKFGFMFVKKSDVGIEDIYEMIKNEES